jgi:hypothetical protein
MNNISIHTPEEYLKFCVEHKILSIKHKQLIRTLNREL